MHDFIVRICDCKMDSQKLYRPGSHVRRKCQRKSRPRVHAVFTLRLHLRLQCPTLHLWSVNECVNAKARKIIRISPFLAEGHKCASWYFHFRCVWARNWFIYWHPDMPTLPYVELIFYTTDVIETWITNKNKQGKSVFRKSCLSEKREKFFLKANAWICSHIIYLRGCNYRLFIKMASSTDLHTNKNVFD